MQKKIYYIIRYLLNKYLTLLCPSPTCRRHLRSLCMKSHCQGRQKFSLQTVMFWNSLHENVIQNLPSINNWQIYLKDLRAYGIGCSQHYANNVFRNVQRRKIESMKMRCSGAAISGEHCDTGAEGQEFLPQQALRTWAKGEKLLCAMAKRKLESKKNLKAFKEKDPWCKWRTCSVFEEQRKFLLRSPWANEALTDI